MIYLSKIVHSAPVKNIIFDLGNVILNIDYWRTIDAFKSLGAADFESLYTPLAQKGFIDKMDKGMITPAEFRESLRSEVPALRGVSDDNIDAAWNAMLLDLPKSRLDILTELRRNYSLFLLSNTNEIHVAHFDRIVDEVIPGKKMSDYFDKVYYSNETGMRKPDAEIYELVIRENGLKAEESLFIDDLQANIDGAKKVGLQTFLMENGNFWRFLDC
ncbi:MAG: HAD family phosphatase [Prevotellaceae bacterium]|jgi:putative hydrolase of the HAD superfamily|nr:HAD family phosphatase [Prevotellaceae bacterium]